MGPPSTGPHHSLQRVSLCLRCALNIGMLMTIPCSSLAIDIPSLASRRNCLKLFLWPTFHTTAHQFHSFRTRRACGMLFPSVQNCEALFSFKHRILCHSGTGICQNNKSFFFLHIGKDTIIAFLLHVPYNV